MKKYGYILFPILFLTFLFALTSDTGISGEKSTSQKGYLGIFVEPLTRHLKKELKADYGVVISRVEIDSPADEYGLMEDDVIQQVNEIKIRRPHTLTRVIRKIKPGDKAKISIIRDGKKKTIEVVIGKLKKSTALSYSLPAPDMRSFSFNVFSPDKIYLGVHLWELDENLAPYFHVKPDEGVLVLEVEEDSPAEEADLKPGDVILNIDGEKVTDSDDVREILADYEENDQIEITIIRQGKTKKVTVVLEERDDHHNIFISPGEFYKKILIRPTEKILKFNEDRDIKIQKKLSKIYSPNII